LFRVEPGKNWQSGNTLHYFEIIARALTGTLTYLFQ
jgi:hypothetical protein